ncbi:DedA family protein [Roseomonas hellenica]|uniref:DedA family protein n=1 Tax=Plastoroseomonas hellenica TaxID=2687306 RepID=A0ABS5EW17_9PROT|nr:DedA family protein [Plastoroseomonas hellenica]MBR0664492.1 DedA family protein [Plastoroseomonas hellenica]
MVDWVIRTVGDFGLPGVFFLMFLENLFPPIPSEVIMPLAGFASAQGKMSFVGAVVAGVLGTLVGNAVWYELARRIGADRIRPLVERYGKWFAITGEDMREAEQVLRKYGPVALSFGRLLPGIRTLISVPAGLVHIPRPVFYFWTALGTAVWLVFLASLGLLLEDHYAEVDSYVEPLGYVVVALVVGGYALHLLRAWRRSRARSQG